MSRADHREGFNYQQDGISVSYQRTIKAGTDLAQDMWQTLHGGFSALDDSSFYRQSMTKDEFEADMASPDVGKLIVRQEYENQPAEVIGLATCLHSPDAVTWANQEELQRLFHSPIRSGTFSYVGEIVIDTSKRGLQAGTALLKGIGHYLHHYASGRSPVYAGYDFAHANQRLPSTIARVCGGPDLGLRTEVIARHGQFLIANAAVLDQLGRIDQRRLPVLGDEASRSKLGSLAVGLELTPIQALIDGGQLSPRVVAAIGESPAYLLEGLDDMSLVVAKAKVVDELGSVVDGASEQPVLIVSAPLGYSKNIGEISTAMARPGKPFQAGLIDIQSFAVVKEKTA